MLLAPRYDAPPIIAVELRSDAPHPVVRQRRRLAQVLAELPAADWQRPSRCEGWSVQDVVAHLVSTNGFWEMSIRAGLAGEPTRFMAAFDPAATPAALVEHMQGTSVGETLDQLVASNESLAAVVEGLTEADWDVLGEAPPGHVPMRMVADHALWDAWIHERDICLPLGRTPVVEPDEVQVSLRYCAALGRAILLTLGSAEQGAVELVVRDPDDRLVVEAGRDVVRVHGGAAPAGTLVLEGDAVEMVEALSLRVPADRGGEGLAWLTAGLAEAFDQPAGA